MAEKTYGEFIEDVVELDASGHHKGRRPAKVWLVDRESGMRFGVTVVRHLGDALEIVFSSVNPARKEEVRRALLPSLFDESDITRLVNELEGKADDIAGPLPLVPGDHVLDMSTFDRMRRTATCSTCGPDSDVINPGKPGQMLPENNWQCPNGQPAQEVRSA